MVQKAGLYFHTIRYMKPSQVYYRIKKKAGFECTLGYVPGNEYHMAQSINVPTELDFDPIFIARFPAEDFLNDKVSFLHSSCEFHWNEEWNLEEQTPLWNFNLHYFEYLFSLWKAYRDSDDIRYFNKANYCIKCWIDNNPVGKGSGWSAYTISLRLTNWISYYAVAKDILTEGFKKVFLDSLHQQYQFLARHIEKDILGNHYFENLKALILGAIFFDDSEMLRHALIIFKKECAEQILPDGMHFELSPMYHKIVLEDVIRVALALNGIGYQDSELENYIARMLDVAWSFEEGIDRIPLFNDCGTNVSKSLNALVSACENRFGIKPNLRTQFPESGYYIFKWDDWKLIVDAGQPGPTYIPGHSHCDAMSFELFYNGKPAVVNCGTYAYQCKERPLFRSTQAHNTVQLNGIEQSQCWSNFRLAKRSRVKVFSIDKSSICMQMTDQKGRTVDRTISITNKEIIIQDRSADKMRAFLHMRDSHVKLCTHNNLSETTMDYAEEYGKKESVKTYCLEGRNILNVSILL